VGPHPNPPFSFPRDVLLFAGDSDLLPCTRPRYKPQARPRRTVGLIILCWVPLHFYQRHCELLRLSAGDDLAGSRHGGLRGQLANLIGEPASEEHPHLRKPHAAAVIEHEEVRVAPLAGDRGFLHSFRCASLGSPKRTGAKGAQLLQAKESRPDE